MKDNQTKEMWVYAESLNGEIAAVSLELCCQIRKLCDTAGKNLAAVYIGQLDESSREQLANTGIDRIINVTTNAPALSTEALSGIFARLCREFNPDAVFVGATSSGRDFAPHFAAALGTGCTSDATELEYDAEKGCIEFIEPAAGGKIMAVITIPELRPQVGTIRPGTFAYAPSGSREPEIMEIRVDIPEKEILSDLLSLVKDNDEGNALAKAEKVICVGNGIKDKSSLAKYQKLAELMGASLGCTRPVVDRGLMPYSCQIGQSGIGVRPALYICFGVSGAVNHVTGVHAENFFAVNSDPEALVFNYCTHGLVADMDEVCDMMIAEFQS